MKLIKMSLIALTLGIFVASCSNATSEPAPATTEAVAPATTAPAEPAHVDTTTAPPAKPMTDTAVHTK